MEPIEARFHLAELARTVGTIEWEVVAGRLDPALVRSRVAKTLSHITRSEEHTSELQSLMRISYAVFCVQKKSTKSRLPSIVRAPLRSTQRQYTKGPAHKQS